MSIIQINQINKFQIWMFKQKCVSQVCMWSRTIRQDNGEFLYLHAFTL